MELDLFDAIRLRRVVEISCEGVTRRVEPYEVRDREGEALLFAFDLNARDGGWKEYSGWSDLRISSTQFEVRGGQSDQLRPANPASEMGRGQSSASI